MVVRLGDTITAVARSMLDQLHLSHAHVLGAVLNCVPHQKDAKLLRWAGEKQRTKGSEEHRIPKGCHTYRSESRFLIITARNPA